METTIHDLINELLRHPPRGFHLVICTRTDPPVALVELRAQYTRLAFEVACAGLELAGRVGGSRAHLVSGQLIQQLLAPVDHTHMGTEKLVLWDTNTIYQSRLERAWSSSQVRRCFPG